MLQVALSPPLRENVQELDENLVRKFCYCLYNVISFLLSHCEVIYLIAAQLNFRIFILYTVPLK